MDFGLKNRTAIVCASSAGLGLACALSLAREGAQVLINGRNEVRLRAAIAEVERVASAPVLHSVADITTPEGRLALLRACPEPDILINNNAGPLPGVMADWTHEVWLGALEANMLAAVFLIQAVVPGMRERQFGRIVNITSAMVKQPRPHLGLSTAARAGLTAFAKAISFECAADNVTINNLLPERIDTGRQRFMAERLMASANIDMEEARRRIADTVAAKRFGRPEEFGDACAFFCSQQAGFISGQNLQLDGGSYPGLL